jgi:hypothetical protein
MILAIDMGNSNIVIGGIDDKNTYFLERVTTRTEKTDLEYAINIKTILEIHNIDINDIEGAILSSVVPPLNQIIINAVKKITNLDCILVDSSMETGLKLCMDNPGTIGSDLIVDSVAAMNEYPLPLAVIDMGTATTIFVVNKNKEYIGGIIHPGLKISLESLSLRTAKLPHINLEMPKNIIAKNTIDSMRSGIVYGHAGIMDTCIERMEAELGEELTVIATGGLATFVTPLCKHKIIVDENLLLKGLLILYKKNKK